MYKNQLQISFHRQKSSSDSPAHLNPRQICIANYSVGPGEIVFLIGLIVVDTNSPFIRNSWAYLSDNKL